MVSCTEGAPDNARLALAEEGQPEGAELPEDVTPLMQQISRMQNQPHNHQDPDTIPMDNKTPFQVTSHHQKVIRIIKIIPHQTAKVSHCAA